MMSNESIYRIDYGKLAHWLTPVPLRFSQMRLWLKALIHQVKANYDRFIKYRREARLRASITSSRCRLEYLLNHLYYKPGLGAAYSYRIVLSEGIRKRYLYIFLGDGGAAPAGGAGQPWEENKALYLDENHALYAEEEIQEDNSQTDYLVKIPDATRRGMNEDTVNALKSWLKQYQLPGKKFKIVEY